MNQELLLLEKKCAELLGIIQQLSAESTLALIERDLLKQHCLKLYEQILTLTTSTTEFAQETTTTQSEMAPVSLPETKAPVEIPEPDTIQTELFAETILVNDVPPVVETEPVKEEPVITVTEIKNKQIDHILLEQEKQKAQIQEPDPEISLHDKISHSIEPKTNLMDKLSATVPSLKSAINVNLKIALVNKLFNENTVEYVKSIDRLNSCENIHEAMRYFNELKHQYSWDSEDPNVKELEQLLTKRYN